MGKMKLIKWHKCHGNTSTKEKWPEISCTIILSTLIDGMIIDSTKVNFMAKFLYFLNKKKETVSHASMTTISTM